MRNFFRIFGLLIVALFARQVCAHAHLNTYYHAVNPPGSPWPEALTLVFSEDVEPAFSAVEVIGSDKQRVDRSPAETDPQQHNLLRVHFKQPLTRGEYQVKWRVLSVDGHKTKGNDSFTVK